MPDPAAPGVSWCSLPGHRMLTAVPNAIPSHDDVQGQNWESSVPLPMSLSKRRTFSWKAPRRLCLFPLGPDLCHVPISNPLVAQENGITARETGGARVSSCGWMAFCPLCKVSSYIWIKSEFSQLGRRGRHSIKQSTKWIMVQLCLGFWNCLDFGIFAYT